MWPGDRRTKQWSLDELSPLDFKKHIIWLNCAFHVTNFHAPNPILSLDGFCVWCLFLPCWITIALPYRLCRKVRCRDKKMDLNARFCLEVTDSVPLPLHFFSDQHTLPGRYQTQCHRFYLRACPATELKSLLYLMNCWTLKLERIAKIQTDKTQRCELSRQIL